MSKLITPLILLMLIGLTGGLITVFKISPCTAIDPYTICSNFASHALIFLGASLVSFLTGLLSIIGLLIRQARYQKEVFANHTNVAIRQGFLLAITLSLSFILHLTGNFRWWLAIFMLLIITILEYFFSLGESR